MIRKIKVDILLMKNGMKVLSTFFLIGLIGVILFSCSVQNIHLSAYMDIKEVLDPSEYQYLTYNNAQAALQEANSQLTEMDFGSIHTINGNDINLHSELTLDHQMGNIIYWDISTETTGVYIEANTGEIIQYYYYVWSDGIKTQGEILSLAESIASQFCSLPQDRQSPTLEIKESFHWESTDIETNETTIKSEMSWYVRYIRQKESISTEDFIRLIIDKNGGLYSYTKVWNMNLESFSTTYTVTQAQANETAIDDAGEGSVSHSCEKKIVRPNHFWDGNDPEYGLNPVCVWVVSIEDNENSLRIYYIHGTSNAIVGGDYIHKYYE